MKYIRLITATAATLACVSSARSAFAYGLPDFPHGAVYEINHTVAGAVDLTDFQVRVQLDTAAEIAQGRMRADCADLRVYADDGCVPAVATSFWVADGTCNTTKTDVWLVLPTLAKDAHQKAALFWGNPAAAPLSDGATVFPIFFDDFSGGGIDAAKWNVYGNDDPGSPRVSQANGVISGGGGAAAIWSKLKVLAAGQTVFGVRTNAQAQGGADIEYGAATLISGAGSDNVHWASRTYSGVTWMAYDKAAAFVGRQSSAGSCAQNTDLGRKWTNDVGDFTFFQTEFFYELLPGGASTFGIYDKFGDRRETTMGGAACTPPALESAYFQFDHTSGAPNPVSSLDYAYVRKYANPDPILVATGVSLVETCGLPAGTGPCTAQDAAVVCSTQACSPNAFVCIPNATSCWVDADCGASDYCDRGAFTCREKLSSGTALPADTLHDTCPATGVSAACTSNRCNATANACAEENGASCTIDAGCVYGVCDDDNLCGYDDGGPCTAQNQATECRSSRCGATNVCLAPAACVVDADCDADQRCDTSAGSCAADLALGAQIPADHGTCGAEPGSAGPAVAACASGACNAQANTCAGANTVTACSSGSECVANACGDDGSCGYGDRTGTCTQANASVVCRSATCTAGVCGVPVTPEVDAGAPDAATPDAGRDAGAPPKGQDGGTPPVPVTDTDSFDALGGGSGCAVGGGADASWLLGLGLALVTAGRKRLRKGNSASR